jgi:large subunit ribosomal protein L3
MPTVRKPRYGSIQYVPKKRAKRIYARVRSWANVNEPRILGFAGYKAGMTHIMVVDNRAKSLTKGNEISMPVTVIECPPLKISSVRFYKNTTYGLKLISEIFEEKSDKELSRKISLPKKINKKIGDIKDFDIVTLTVHTQPKLTGIGKKKPELFEVYIGGTKEEQLNYAKEKLGKEISVKDIFREGQQIDIHSITRGKGFQGPVRRFGISLKGHKSEKGRRVPGAIAPWCGQGHILWKVAHAGQLGFHQRTEHNKWLLKIGDNPQDINIKGGFTRYGLIKNDYILVKGSVAGPVKRLIRLTYATRPNKLTPQEAPTIRYTSLKSYS